MAVQYQFEFGQCPEVSYLQSEGKKLMDNVSVG
ncbi:porin [Buttiauxella sp. B2]